MLDRAHGMTTSPRTIAIRTTEEPEVYYPNPRELEMLEREEHEARTALASAREQHQLEDGTIPDQHQSLIGKLEEEWKHAVSRLERARTGPKDQQ